MPPKLYLDSSGSGAPTGQQNLTSQFLSTPHLPRWILIPCWDEFRAARISTEPWDQSTLD